LEDGGEGLGVWGVGLCIGHAGWWVVRRECGRRVGGLAGGDAFDRDRGDGCFEKEGDVVSAQNHPMLKISYRSSKGEGIDRLGQEDMALVMLKMLSGQANV
jgi:hypothetical protein